MLVTGTTASIKPRPASWLRKVAPGLLALPIGCFVLFVWTYAVNVPWLDDIDAYLGFVLAYADATTLSEKINTILIPNNEHRIVGAKLITVALYNLTGEVNFRWLILIAGVFLLGILALFARVFGSMRLPVVAFVPVPFLLLQPQYHLTTLWAVTGLQHPVVICLTLFALYLLTRAGRGPFAGALWLQVLATLSMSNGLMGWVAGGVILALSRQWRRLGVWLAGSVVTVWIYFHNFQSAGRTGESLAYCVAHPMQALGAFFTFTGGMFDLIPGVKSGWRYGPPTLAGVVLTALVLGLVYRMNGGFWSVGRAWVRTPLQQRRLFFSGCYVFLFANAAIIALLRLRYGYDVMVVSNYMIYPAVLGVLIYLNVLSEYSNRQPQPALLRLGLLVSMLVWTVAYGLYWPKTAYRKQLLLTNAVNQKRNGIGLGPSWGTPFAGMARQVMRESVRRGIYHYPASYITPVESLLRPAVAGGTADSCLTMQVVGGGYSYRAQTRPDAFPNTLSQAAVLVQSDRHTVLFASETPFTFSNFWLNRPVTAVEAEVINPILAPGRYRVGVLTPSEPERPIQFSCRRITL